MSFFFLDMKRCKFTAYFPGYNMEKWLPGIVTCLVTIKNNK